MRTGEQIIKSRHFVTPEEVPIAVKTLMQQKTVKGYCDDDAILTELCEYSYLFDINADSLKMVISKIIEGERIMSADEQKIQIFITKEEVDCLKDLQVGEGVKKLLFVLLVSSKRSNHPSGWDEYKRKSYLKLLQLTKKPKTYEQWIQQACSNKMVELRVVGSKNPITCFKLAFRNDGGEIITTLSSWDEINTVYDGYIK